MFSIIRWLDKSYSVELSRFVKRKNGVLWAKWHGDNQYYRALRVIAQDDDDDMLKELSLDLQGILHFPRNDEVLSFRSSPRLQSDSVRVNPLSSPQRQPPQLVLGEQPPKTPLQSPSPTHSPRISSLDSYAASSTESQCRSLTTATSSRRSWLGERSRAESRISSQSRSPYYERETSTLSVHKTPQSHSYSQIRSLNPERTTHRESSTWSASSSASRLTSSPLRSLASPVQPSPKKRRNQAQSSNSQAAINSLATLIPERPTHRPSSAWGGLLTPSTSPSVLRSPLSPTHSTPLPSRSLWPPHSPRPRSQATVRSQSSLAGERTRHPQSQIQRRSPTRYPPIFTSCSPTMPVQSSSLKRGDSRQRSEPQATVDSRSLLIPVVRTHQRSSIQSPLQSHLLSQSSHQPHSPWTSRSHTWHPPPSYNSRNAEEPSAPIKQRNCNPLIQPSRIPINLNRMSIPLSPLRRSENATLVNLIQDTNVFINRDSLKKILKEVVYEIHCTPDPRELARRLMKNIVGCDRLKGMTAKGDRRTGLPGIPEGPYYAVFDYVNALLPDLALDLNTYRIVMGKMCNWLRDPKKR